MYLTNSVACLSPVVEMQYWSFLTSLVALASFANILRNKSSHSGKSLTQIKNNSGPKTEPCGTPLATPPHSEETPLSVFVSLRLSVCECLRMFSAHIHALVNLYAYISAIQSLANIFNMTVDNTLKLYMQFAISQRAHILLPPTGDRLTWGGLDTTTTPGPDSRRISNGVPRKRQHILYRTIPSFLFHFSH